VFSDVSSTGLESSHALKAPHALKGQKLLAQGNTLGNDRYKPVALKGQKLSLLREKVFFEKKVSKSHFLLKISA
jgi:hypothetical protein